MKPFNSITIQNNSVTIQNNSINYQGNISTMKIPDRSRENRFSSKLVWLIPYISRIKI